MPALGAGMDVGKIIEWYVSPGDEVRRGTIIALVETDKANIEVEVFEDGVVEELLIEEGTKVPVGTPLARIGAGAEVVGAEAPPDAPAAVPDTADTLAAALPDEAVDLPDGVIDEDPFVLSPLVRRQAQDSGVDLTRVRGTGPGGVITRGDVAAAAGTARDVVREIPDERGPASPERVAAAAGAPAHVPAIARSGMRSSPYARRLAAEQGIELGDLGGTGPGGALVARDITEAGRAAGGVPHPSELEAGRAPLEAEWVVASTAQAAVAPERDADDAADRGRAMRQAIARAMERSNREIPHYYLGETVDAEPLLDWLTEINAERAPAQRLLPAAVVLKATALALQRFGDFNGYWINDDFQPGEGIHLGVAISLRRGGLLAPAIRDVDQLPLDELMEALKDLVERTRSGGLRGSELTDPTITVSNLGDTGVESIHGVITPPQVAFVGVGRITERPWTIDGMLTVRRTLFLSLAGDHRASDGHRGGRFLGAIATNLGRPETL